MTDLSSRIAAASGDAGALLALAIELAQENARLAGHAAALEEAESERKELQASRKRRQRHGTSRDVTGQDGTSRSVPSGFSPSPQVSLLSPTPPNNSSFPPPPFQGPPASPAGEESTPRPSGQPAVRPARKGRRAEPAGPTWVAVGVAWWEQSVGAMTHGRFGKALSGVVAIHGWEPVQLDMGKWVAQRKLEQKACKLEWYADEASARITADPPAVWDAVRKCLTPYGERMTRPDKVPA